MFIEKKYRKAVFLFTVELEKEFDVFVNLKVSQKSI